MRYLVIALCLAFSWPAWASELDMYGTVTYSYVGSTAILGVERIDNLEASGTSGTLRVELWAFSSPYTGAAQLGYQMAKYNLSPLPAGYYWANVSSGTIPFAKPPNGIWHFTMFVSEYTGNFSNDSDGFTPRDHHNFIGTETFGPPPAPNLTISAFSASPTAVKVGGTSTLTATVGNVGASSSGATTLRYFYWTGSAWSEITTCARSVGTLTPGSSSIKSCDITMPSTAEYLFVVHVDTVPGESNTADNDSAQIIVTVGAAPPHALMAMTDFNGDGKSDIVFENGIGTRWLYYMNGATVQTTTAMPAAAPGWVLVGMGDFDGNGTTDTLWQNSANRTQHWIYLMNGPTIIGGGMVTVAPGFTPTYIADFNADGKSDILWENITGGRWLFFMSGSTVASSAAVPPTAPGWEIAGVGDFNGDHRSDLLWVNTANPTQYWIYLMNGSAVIGNGGLNVGAGYQPTWIGDMNRDGKADIVWENGTSSRWVYTMNGAAFGTGFSLPQAAAGWEIVGVGDFNNVGGLDLLWQNTANPTQYWIYLLNTTGTLTGSGGLTVAPGYEPLAY